MSEAITKALQDVIAAHDHSLAVMGEQMRDAGITALTIGGPDGEAALMMFEAISAARAALSQPAPSPQPAESALEKYRRLGVDAEETGPIERLRTFCSFAMNGQDWLDVEPFFGALRESPQPAAPVVPEGFVIVPVEPTEAMIQAGIDEMPHFTDEPGPVWSAMLAASQQKGDGDAS